MNAQDNNSLFDHSAPRQREEASESHWVNAPRENFTQRTQEQHGARMRRSRLNRAVGSMIVGHVGRQK